MNDTGIRSLQHLLDPTANKFIQASAGSGKTFILSKYYCSILDSYAFRKDKGISNILVITFTRKAAAEMKSRIMEDLNLLLSGRQIPEFSNRYPEFAENLRSEKTDIQAFKKGLRNHFSSNQIMTIDSFCSSVLRQYAHRIGLDPLFISDDGIMDKQLRQDTLKEFIQSLNAKADSRLQVLLQNMSLKHSQAAISYIHDYREELEEWIQRFTAQGTDAIRSEWLRHYVKDFDLNSLSSRLDELIKTANSACKNPGDALNVLIQKLNEKMQLLHTFPHDLEKKHFFILHIVPLFMTQNETFRKSVPGSKTAWDGNFKAEMNDFLTELQLQISVDDFFRAPSEDDFKAIPLMKALASLSKEFAKIYRQKSLQNNFLSFNDIILYTLNLLRENPDIRTRYAAQFDYILVDEFQDTNDRRWEIIRLISDSKESLRKEGIFIVGDSKQSIFRFQKADVKVMQHAHNEMLQSPLNNPVFTLNENYRSSKSYLEKVVNPIFQTLMPSVGQERQPYESYFEPATAPAGKQSRENGINSDIVAHVWFSFATKEMYTPAHHTLKAVEKAINWCETQHFNLKPGQAKIAILLRTFTHIHEYQSLFFQKGIELEILSGRGLYQQQETFDIFHLLSLMINPLDDFALLGCLRSPFMLVDDSQIHLLSRRKKDESIYHYCQKNDQLSFIYETISQWRKDAYQHPFHNFVRQILSKNDGELAYVSEFAGPQRLKNLDKILGIIQGKISNGMSLYALYEFLKFNIEQNTDEAQALLPGNYKVQILTIHKAKGLEFPVVILPEMNGKPLPQRDSVAYGQVLEHTPRELGLSLENDEGRDVKTHILKTIMSQNKAEDEAEQLRLFYVAVTRAQYKIYFLSDFKSENMRKISNSWYQKFLVPVYGLEEKPESQTLSPNIVVDNIEFKNWCENDFSIVDSEKNIPQKSWKEYIPFIRNPKRFRDVTPHDLIQKDIHFQNVFTDTQQDIRENARISGLVFHNLLEQRLWDITRDDLEIKIRKTFPDSSITDISTKVLTHLNIFKQTNLYERLNKIASEDYFPELKIQGFLENGQDILRVNGIVDLLIREGDSWTLFDYKTDSSTQNLSRYSIQIQSYLWMLKQMYNIEAQAFIYFSVSGELKEIHFEESYFSKISTNPQDSYSTYSPPVAKLPRDIIELLKTHRRQKILFLHPTRRYVQEFNSALSAAKLHSPQISNLTLDQLLESQTFDGKKHSPFLGKLLIRKELKAKSNFSQRGHISLLWSAYSQTETSSAQFSKEFAFLKSGLAKRMEEKHIFSRFKQIQSFDNSVLNNTILIIRGILSINENDFVFLSNLSKAAKDVYFRNVFTKNTLSRTFDYTSQIWNTFSTESLRKFDKKCTRFHSIEEEIDYCARQICTEEPHLLETTKIIVSSMDRYLPLIQKIFNDYGIPFRSEQASPALQLPFIQWIVTLMELLTGFPNITWSQLHSLLVSSYFNTDIDISSLDYYLRDKGLTDYSAIDQHFSKAYADSSMKNQWLYLHKTVLQHFQNKINSSFDVRDKILKLIEKFVNSNSTNVNLLEKIKTVIRYIPENYNIVGIKANKRDFLLDFREEIKSLTIKKDSNFQGVEIVSLLNSVHIHANRMYVLGLSEGQFPFSPSPNPYLKELTAPHEQLNHYLFMSLCKRKGHILFSAPESDEKGQALSDSPYLHYLQTKDAELSWKNSFSRQGHFQNYYHHIIKNPPISPLFQRHNDLQQSIFTKYNGKTGHSDSGLLKISSYRLDDLLKCPQRYWYGSKLNIKNLEFDESARDKKNLGSLVHKIIELFSKAGGFESPSRKDAIRLLKKSIDSGLEEYSLTERNDILTQKRLRPYIADLDAPDSNNLLLKLLDWNEEVLYDYERLEDELAFGDKEAFILDLPFGPLQVSGYIDRVLQHKTEAIILATDIKTGSIKIKDLKEHLATQLILYYLALKKLYPQHKICLVYEQLKSTKESGLSEFVGDENELFTKKSIIFNPQRGSDSLTLDLNEIFETWQQRFDLVKNGNFPLSELPADKACAYCDYERVCRKTTRF